MHHPATVLRFPRAKAVPLIPLQHFSFVFDSRVSPVHHPLFTVLRPLPGIILSIAYLTLST